MTIGYPIMHMGYPAWLEMFYQHLAAHPFEVDAKAMGQRIHEALEIAEVRQFATPESKFTFELVGASEEDLATIRATLTPFENSLCEIKRRP